MKVSTNPAKQCEIRVNGELKLVSPGLSIAALLDILKVEPARVAVELDRAIIKRADWHATAIPAGAELEIVQFVGGG